MSDKTKFHVQINGGPEQTLEVKTGKYGLAAIASLALLDYVAHDDYDVVKIWIPELVEEYGPYFYAWNGFGVGHPHDSRKW